MSGKPKRKTAVTDESEPKQVAQQPEDDRKHGLWVNEAFVRKHQNRPPILAPGTALGLTPPKAPKSKAPPNAENIEKPATAPKRCRTWQQATNKGQPRSTIFGINRDSLRLKQPVKAVRRLRYRKHCRISTRVGTNVDNVSC